ncbi:hypothetical protein BX616_010852 [Lobosporangium transversale]|nr:hypothetical protein BX616_010852 [Lobosporangium transversale]
MADWTGNINSNINNKTNNSSSSMHEDANSTAAVNACRLMDSIMTTPTWNHSIFTDSVQLFSTDLLREAEEPQQKRYHQTISGTKTLETIFSEIQEALYAAQQRLESKLGEVPYNANYISSSISLKLDQNMKASFDRATTELIRSMQKFEELYEQELSQSITAYHHRHHLCNESGDVTQLSSKQQQQETVPGLGEAASSLNMEQNLLLSMLNDTHELQKSLVSLISPSSETQQNIQQAKKDLLRGTDDPDVQSMLDRLKAMTHTLEKSRQRIKLQP